MPLDVPVLAKGTQVGTARRASVRMEAEVRARLTRSASLRLRILSEFSNRSWAKAITTTKFDSTYTFT